MAQQEHAFDDPAFQEGAAEENVNESAFLAADEQIVGRLLESTSQPGIGRNGHRSNSGSLAPVRPDAKPRPRLLLAGTSRQKWLPLALGLVGLLVILTCLGAGAVVALNLLSSQNSLNQLSFQNSLDSPDTTLDDFYNALRTGNYQSAYNQLSSHYQQQVGSETAFENTWEFLQGDPIQSYQINSVQTQSQNASATVQVVRGMQGATPENQLHKVALIVENNAWKIDKITITSPSS